jgi:ATP-dependent Lhr-like helicase
MVFGRDGLTKQTGLDGIWAGLLGQPPRNGASRVDPTLSRQLEKLLQKIGIQGLHKHRKIGPFKLAARAFDAGPTWEDYLAENPALPGDQVRRIRIYLLLLAGRSWRVTWIDFKRRCCFVEPADGGGKARWIFPGTGGASFALSRAIRDVLLGADPPARLTSRAEARLAGAREAAINMVHPGGTVISRDSGRDVRWWTWAGLRANATLIATLSSVADTAQRAEEFFVRLRSDVTPDMWHAAVTGTEGRLCLPAVDDKALDGLKFSAALPRHLAEATLAARLADLGGAEITLAEPARFLTL